MKRTFERYGNVGYRFVTGFLQPGNLPVLKVLDAAQRSRGVDGGIAEIGVHHGRLFIALHLLQRGLGKSVAIDLFGDQDLNIDGSGHGDLGKFTDNVALWSTMDGLVLHQGDSTKLTPEVLRDKADGPIRFFSVDGGHTEEIVYSDMRLAEATLADGGIVIADDVFNQQWPGVAVGTLKYLEDGAKLVPFGIGFNKTLFTQPEYAEYYRTELESAFAGSLRIQSDSTVFAGHPVVYLAPVTPVDVLRRSETARSIYHRTYKEMVRGMQLVSGKSTPGR
ncbi:class I SAM-dependent methyltransferase [Mycolicibacterium sp.]|uniref:class I SAM-dependent methyltransferase n=1 Tax=Mycolicibacterium sp. TaxID=2320850 RepID=UPI001A35C86F|nr:class I SAM-dependent methyltransferase [Mycolicibacterium sp.]MBJ7339068.1 class I SAM-dependent methyltransferase [Mycolicibacterium sp.]